MLEMLAMAVMFATLERRRDLEVPRGVRLAVRLAVPSMLPVRPTEVIARRSGMPFRRRVQLQEGQRARREIVSSSLPDPLELLR
jgi:hypothetical protein